MNIENTFVACRTDTGKRILVSISEILETGVPLNEDDSEMEYDDDLVDVFGNDI